MPNFRETALNKSVFDHLLPVIRQKSVIENPENNLSQQFGYIQPFSSYNEMNINFLLYSLKTERILT